MYIEDLIDALVRLYPSPTEPTDLKILTSLRTQITFGQNLTEKQANLAVNLLKKHREKISNYVGLDIKKFLDNPVYKHPFRVVNLSRDMRIVTDSDNIKLIKVSFPYDEIILEKIKALKISLFKTTWEPEERCWYFSSEEKSIDFLQSIAEEFNFTTDEEFKILAHQTKHIKENLEKYVPMAIYEQGKIKHINISQFSPQNTSTDFIESIFFTKMAGILTWDDHIENEISNLPCSDTIKKIIKSDPGVHSEINLELTPLAELSLIMKYLFPCIVIIPSENETASVTKNVEFFNSIGIDNSNMSVLFRLPTETDKNFNDYVKNNGLNSPISNNTKVVFISTKIPKTILGNKLEFNSVLNYNYYNAHYKIRDFLKNKVNVINILDRGSQRRLNFAIM
jgi:hypothetical protein